MHYIYCYTNKINQHKYVGQTNNLKRRIREHSSCSFNPNACSYNDLIHKKIRQYGENNFEISILETLYTDDIQEVNAREQYWIEKLETYCGFGKGYNMDLGGNQAARSRVLTPEQLKEVKEKIKLGVPYLQIGSEYKISPSFISSINTGVYFYDEKESYPLFKYYKDNSDYDELIDLLLHSNYSLKKISEILGIGYSTVKKINAGTLRKGLYPTYPIRKTSTYLDRANRIKKLLMTTNYSNAQIAQMEGSCEETVRRINIGETFKNEKLSYPLRNL